MSAPLLPPGGESSSVPISVYRAPNSREYAPPPPELDDFEPTPGELRAAFADAIRERHGPNAPLMTSAMRAKYAQAQGQTKKQYDSILIRVRFSDRTQIERAFSHDANMKDVYDFVDSVLRDSHGYGTWSNPSMNATTVHAPLKSEYVAQARDMPLPAAQANHPYVPSVRPPSSDDGASDAQDARAKRKFPKWFKSTGGAVRK